MKIQEDSIFKEDYLEVTKKIENDLVDLIYIEPPFFTQNVMSSWDKRFSFNDKWDTIDDYLNYLKPRILDFKRILKNTGCIFVHCDRNASAYIKCMLDDVFGLDNFQSEIIWAYKRWSNSKKGLLNAHQTIFFYSKTKEFKFNKLFTNYSTTTNLDQILQARKMDENGQSFYLKDENGKIVNASKKAGVPLSDVWEIPFLNPKAKERVNYPTQKPIELLEQIIKLTTDEGDLVFDGFMGSGTTLVAAKLLNRHYIECDISYDGYTLSIQRLNCPIKTESILLKSGYRTWLC